MSAAPKLREADYAQDHPAGLPIAADLPLPDPTAFEDPSCVTAGPSLSADEAAHFKSQGFIVKRGLIDDDAVFDQVIEHIWRNVPRGLMRRDDPETWIGGPEDDIVATATDSSGSDPTNRPASRRGRR